MKEVLTSLAAVIGSTYLAFGQGYIAFDNAGVSAPIFEHDGVTPLAGRAYLAGLWISADTNATWADQFRFTGIEAPFATGEAAGYFYGGVPGIEGTWPGESVALQVRAWRVADGADFAVAQAAPGGHWGISGIVVELLSLYTQGSPPTELYGLRSFNLGANPIPEPSVLALAVLAGLLLLRGIRSGRDRPTLTYGSVRPMQAQTL